MKKHPLTAPRLANFNANCSQAFCFAADVDRARGSEQQALVRQFWGMAVNVSGWSMMGRSCLTSKQLCPAVQLFQSN